MLKITFLLYGQIEEIKLFYISAVRIKYICFQNWAVSNYIWFFFSNKIMSLYYFIFLTQFLNKSIIVNKIFRYKLNLIVSFLWKYIM